MSRQFFHDDALEFRDNFRGSDRDKRYIDQLIQQDATRLSKVMSEQYSGTTERLTKDLESVLRICEEGDGVVDDIIEDLRDGNITAREAAAKLGAARRDLNRLRKVADDAPEVETRAWAEVNVTPGAWQRNLQRRAPVLFRDGRGLLELPTDDD